MSDASATVADMTELTVERATDVPFDDVQHALTGGGDGGSCQCQWWLMTGRQFDARTRDDRRDLLHDELTTATVSPALVARIDGEAVGWVRVGPRTAQPRLARTRTFAASPHPWGDPTVWAVTCFVVRRTARGRGVMAALLDAAVAHARAHGARVVEAYPIDTAVRDAPSNELYTGVLSTFVAAGFREVARPKPHRVIVTLNVA